MDTTLRTSETLILRVDLRSSSEHTLSIRQQMPASSCEKPLFTFNNTSARVMRRVASDAVRLMQSLDAAITAGWEIGTTTQSGCEDYVMHEIITLRRPGYADVVVAIKVSGFSGWGNASNCRRAARQVQRRTRRARLLTEIAEDLVAIAQAA